MGLKLTSHARTKTYEAAGFWGEGCLHDFLVRNASIAPKAPALIDPPDREAFAQGVPVALDTEETLFAVKRLVQVFDQLGLQAGDLLGLQLPQIVEAPIAIVAAARAGLMVCLLPPHWGRREISRALGPVAPRAILSWAAPGHQPQTRLEALREVALNLPSIRFLLAIGGQVPDGIVPLGDFAFDAQRRAKRDGVGLEDEPARVPDQTDANDVVMVTWPVASRTNVRALARSHNEYKATGLGIVDAADLDDGSRFLCPFPLSSYAAAGTFLVPWLLCRGCLVFHRAFDLAGFTKTLAQAPTAFTAIPARLESQLLEALAGENTPAISLGCLGVLRDPNVATSQAGMPPAAAPPLLDILNLNDLALHAEIRTSTGQISIPNTRRSGTGSRPPPLLETHLAPPRADDAPGAAELFVRSPMTPSAAVGGDDGLFSALQDADGFVAAGLVARKSNRRFIPSAISPPGHVVHGGLNLDLADLKALYAGWPPAANAKIDVMADGIMGNRLEVTLEISPGSTPATAGQFRAFLQSEGAGDHMVPDVVRLIQTTGQTTGQTAGQNAAQPAHPAPSATDRAQNPVLPPKAASV